MSRQPDVEKVYVQTLLLKQSHAVYKNIVNDNGHIYICGDMTMANKVEQVLVRILCKEGSMDEVKAHDFIERLSNQNRYHKDIYSVKLQIR